MASRRLERNGSSSTYSHDDSSASFSSNKTGKTGTVPAQLGKIKESSPNQHDADASATSEDRNNYSMSIDISDSKERLNYGYPDHRRHSKTLSSNSQKCHDNSDVISVASSICSSTTGGSSGYKSVVKSTAWAEREEFNSLKKQQFDNATKTKDITSKQKEMKSPSSVDVTPKKRNTKVDDKISSNNDGEIAQKAQNQLEVIMSSRHLASKLLHNYDAERNKVINHNKKQKYHGNKDFELYASTSLMTQSTAELTEIPSASPLSEIYTSISHQATLTNTDLTDDPLKDDDLSTPRLLMRFAKLKDRSSLFASPPVSPCYNDNSAPTSDEKNDPEEDGTMLTSTAIQSVASSVAESKFNQIMAKYENKKYEAEDKDNELNKASYSSGYSKQQSSSSVKHSQSPVSCLKIQPSKDEDFFMIPQVDSMDSSESNISTLSRTTAGFTTVGSISITTENSAVIESYVESIVCNILAHEVESAGSMKKELERALKKKLKLGARVKKLQHQYDQQTIELKRAHTCNKIEEKRFNREMEIHLTRKASKMKGMIEVALHEAEESKRRANEVAQRDTQKEVSLLRSQLEAVQSKHGIPINSSLHNALQLVESNQEALQKAAEKDANKAIEMKKDIENSYVNAIDEFESWSDQQLQIMEKRWGSLGSN